MEMFFLGKSFDNVYVLLSLLGWLVLGTYK